MNTHSQPRSLAALSILTIALVAGTLALPGSSFAQDTAPSTADDQSASEQTIPANDAPISEPGEEPGGDEPTAEEPAADAGAIEEAPATDAPPTVEAPAGEQAAEDDLDVLTDEEAEQRITGDDENDVPMPVTDTTAAAAAAAEAASSGYISPYVMAAIIVALFVVPALIGTWSSRRLGMPDHGWKIALAIGTIAAGVLAILFAASREDGFKLGPDLGGGVTLIYDLADPDLVADEDAAGQEAGDAEADTDRRAQFSMDELLAALKERIDPSGTREVTIRTRGRSIEFIIPKAGQAELEYIKRKITALGQLEFRILVDSRRSEYENIVRLARNLPPGQTVVKIGGNPEARWVPYKIDEFGGLDETESEDPRTAGLVKRMGVNGPELLVKLDSFNVTGRYLTSARKGVGMDGYEVRFTFNAQGAKRFGELTRRHLPNPNPYYLGVILDDQVLSAPSLRGRITSQGQISGNMSEEEVDYIVSILNAGSLPAALNKTPVSEAQTGPEIGELTIRQGTRAIAGSLAAVLVFMLIYYRFAGITASLALVANMVLVIGAMVLLSAAFTLPGLAGLVLTVGMSVDANVLIFERIREELTRGATLRMAIRNGFGRATTTIVDANVTTLITGIVLYVIGTDQIKGFAITLILGILMSMYTAIFCSRILFDIAERKNWLTELKMMRLLSKTDFNFMNKWPVATGLSLALIVVGMFAVADRETNLLNIDFTGGTSVTMVLDEEHAMHIGEVRETLLQTELADKNLLVVGRDQDGIEGTMFKIDTSVVDDATENGEPAESSVEQVENIIAEAFGDRLQSYVVSADAIRPFTEGQEGENQYRGWETTLHFGEEGADEDIAGVTHDTIEQEIELVLEEMGRSGVRPVVSNPEYTAGSSRRFRDWTVRLVDMEESEARQVIETLLSRMDGEPIFPLANKIGGRVAGDMQTQAIYAILVSLIGIIGYIWIRFQKISFGLAAVAALVHDVCVTLGLIALSAYAVDYMPPLASALQLEAFQISLPIVAAFLTIIGYSLNDTIVIFDRIREVRGKSPTLTADMINASVNQTLSRTILTSLTTLVVVGILYFFGGAGIHSFAFALVIGVIAGTYSTVFIASPFLLWLSGIEQKWGA